MRLDRFVQTQLRATSRTRTQLIVELGAFTTEGAPLKKNHRVRAEERIALWREAWDEPHTDVELPIVYEDESLIAINKPPNVAVHPTARHNRSTVTSLLAAQRPGDRLTLLHRIDRETSGVLLLARTRAADRAVKVQFEERKDVLKRYLAMAWGRPSWQRLTCELPLELDPTSKTRVKMRIAAPGEGLESATTFELLDGRARNGRDYSLFRCTLHTGRQHQIRLHLASMGMPIVGDKLYGPDETIHQRAADQALTEDDLAQLELERHALHAAELELDHPDDGRRLRIEAPLLPDMAGFWDGLDRG
jgi:23S rRNA pseudouridine1911/1915/1917 synthase